ncbi:YTH domain-containing protein ECT4-like [Bidens hawaiensis]|uniref:YTH domain-containing protein ECT4-like n=1 Tax=Bidens hawaiensis TaxID=980011 RepID=UPI00404B76EC
MAAVVPPADAADLLKLSLDSRTKAFEPNKKSFANIGNSQVQPTSYVDSSMAYYPNGYGYPSSTYYYGGYDGVTSDWSNYSSYVNLSGVDLAHGGYGYGYGYGYAPYGSYSPAGSSVQTVGHDGPIYGAQTCHYTSPYFQQTAPTGGQYSATASYSRGDITTHAAAGQSPLTGSTFARPSSYQNLSFNTNGSYGRSSQVAMNTTSGYLNQIYSNKSYGQQRNTYQSGYGYGSKAYDLQSNVSGWLTVDNKFKLRSQANSFFGYTNENSVGLNELNRGPRAIATKNQKPVTPITVADKGQSTTENVPKEVKRFNIAPDREQYNKAEFPETYADAKFFIIKSYSEDDIHKSIKYNVWSSTQNGNKKLDAAYQEAQKKPESCPVFLFFSVNTSGQFVGVAEMVGPVDFNKNLDYWQQDKWVGCFPVKWHIVKDIHNSLLRHIVLEYNENKPVTNSRDTQEVKLEHGLQMIKIFKEHSGKQCVLDDFQFYEDRQKKILEIKANQQRFQKHAWEGKAALDEKFKEGVKVEVVNDLSRLVNEVKLADSVEDAAAKPAEK